MTDTPRPMTPPTARMIRLYRSLADRFGGEADDILVFDPATLDDPPPFLALTHVAVWQPVEGSDVTHFATLGMSERMMPRTDYRCEFRAAVRRTFDDRGRMMFGGWLANLAAYPFENDLRLDHREVINHPGRIPFFSGCTHLAIWGRFNDDDFEVLPDEEGEVKFLTAVPITPHERHLLVAHGHEAFSDYIDGNKIDLLSDRELK